MYILNDYSIDNQFNDIEDFLDSLLDYTIPLLKIMDNYNLELLKSYEIYSRKITRDLSIIKLLNVRGYPEIYKFKSLLHKRLYDDPYWQNENSNHDCIAEALKRKTGLISFEHKKYLDDKIEYIDEDVLQTIPNSYNKMQLLEELWEKEAIDIDGYLKQKYSKIQSFCIIGDKNYFDELVKCKHIKQVEINKIVNELNDFMYKYLSNQDLGRLSKNLETNLHEFRTSLFNSKELRIIYCINNSKIVFLNCFIKKQEKTPENEKELARKLRDSIMNKIG